MAGFGISGGEASVSATRILIVNEYLYIYLVHILGYNCERVLS